MLKLPMTIEEKKKEVLGRIQSKVQVKIYTWHNGDYSTIEVTGMLLADWLYKQLWSAYSYVRDEYPTFVQALGGSLDDFRRNLSFVDANIRHKTLELTYGLQTIKTWAAHASPANWVSPPPHSASDFRAEYEGEMEAAELLLAYLPIIDKLVAAEWLTFRKVMGGRYAASMAIDTSTGDLAYKRRWVGDYPPLGRDGYLLADQNILSRIRWKGGLYVVE